MSGAIFTITDGTSENTINLLDRGSGYILCDWRPSRPMLEYAMNKNWFSGTETPATLMQKPVVDTITLKARNVSADALIANEQKLNRILYQASLYWTGNKSVGSPFYIAAKNKDETGIRYATIFSAQLHDSSNPYAAPFFSEFPVSDGLTVAITHGDWLDCIPGSDGSKMYNNITSTIDSRVTHRNQGIQIFDDYSRIPLTNYLSHQGLTHIYRGDQNTNMIEEDKRIGYDLFVTGGASTYTYFGIHVKSTIVYSGGRNLFGIYFNIAHEGITAPGTTFEWEMRAGSSWIPMEVFDDTSGLTVPGTVFFKMIGLVHPAYYLYGIWGTWVRVKPSGTITGDIPSIQFEHPTPPMLPFFDVLFSDIDREDRPDVAPSGYSIGRPVFYSRGLNFFPLYEATEDAEAAAGNEPFSIYLDSSDVGLHAVNTLWSTTAKEGYWKLGAVVELKFNTGGKWYAEMAVQIYTTGEFLPPTPLAKMEGIWEVDTGWLGGTVRVAPDFSVNQVEGDALVTTFIFNSDRSTIQMSIQTVISIEWDFGDNSPVETGTTANHIYDHPGVYDVKMTINTTDGRSPYILKYAAVYVSTFNGTVAVITSQRQRGIAPLKPEFSGVSSVATVLPIISYAWDFGDGTTGTGVMPNKTYTELGFHTVKLTITDSDSNVDTVTIGNYIYVDSSTTKVGDNGAYGELQFDIVNLPWLMASEMHENASDLEGISYTIPEYIEHYTHKLHIGAKSLLTEEDKLFHGYFPLKDKDYGSNVPGVWYFPVAYSKIEPHVNAYSGYVYGKWRMSVSGSLDEEIFAILKFDPHIANVYKGTYKIFIRLVGSSYYGDVYWSAGVAPETLPGPYYDSGHLILPGSKTRRVTTSVGVTTNIATLELGSVTFGADKGVHQSLNIYWKPGTSDTSLLQYVKLYDVIIIPQDEWYAEIEYPISAEGEPRKLSLGSLTPSGDVAASLTGDFNSIKHAPIVIPGKPLLLSGKDVRFTTLTTIKNTSRSAGIPEMYSDIYRLTYLSAVKKANRYLGSRGSS